MRHRSSVHPSLDNVSGLVSARPRAIPMGEAYGWICLVLSAAIVTMASTVFVHAGA